MYPMHHAERIDALRISLASPEQIRQWSYGEISKAETIHFRSQKPVPGGLFCERIFGPTRDWTCACGKYQRQHKRGFVCEKCGVELTETTVRRERMGHIDLAAPVVHPWYQRTIGLLLGLSPRHLLAVLSAQKYLITSIDEEARFALLFQQEKGDMSWPHLAHLHVGDLLEEEAYRALSLQYGTLLHAKTGAEAIRDRLDTLDLGVLAHQLHQEIAAQTETNLTTQTTTIRRRLQIVEAFRHSGQNPAWMVLLTIPVLPPELRPLVPLAGNRFVSSDLNDLYCRVIHRNNRLKHLRAQGAPEVILLHEQRLLQDACTALFDNAHRKKPLLGSQRQALKSFTDTLQGKGGLFRHNLLGKRVDYSGRSVIVAGPDLSLHECGLPKEMACELFQPFLMHKLINRHYAKSPKAAKRMVERRDPCIWDPLAEVLFERVVLLNRAPTLHRLSIQAFYPRLIEGNAIQLHPLVCSAFNADFDGDQMAVHVPVSDVAQNEAQRLLLSTHNLRHPASGEPSMAPSQEIVLGCFYLTEERPSTKRAGRIFTDANEARLAYDAGTLDVETPIVVRIDAHTIFEAPPPSPGVTPLRGRVSTTFGRLLFNEIVPNDLGYRNYPMTKECLKALVAECLAACGEETTVRFLDEMKRIGYHYATKSGISFAISDITMPPEREALIQHGQHLVQQVDEIYHQGELTAQERYRQVIDIWSRVTEEISSRLQSVLEPYGTIMTIVKSGATKAKFQQIRQLSGIRGLMASPSGAIIPIPVLSNYLLGLLVWEIFIAASGARKGFMDRSLNTAMSGYLTRRLVEAGMDVIVSQPDCGTREGLWISNEESRAMGLADMRSRISGRILAESVGKLEVGTLLDAKAVDSLLTTGIEWVCIRSPLTCQAPRGVCQRCYGIDLATGQLVRLGTAVGVIAGQSIGEPGTQLTMRTFHSGGIAHNASDITLGLPRVNDLFEARTPPQAATLARRSGMVQAIESEETTGELHIHFTASTPTQGNEQETPDAWTMIIARGRKLMVQEGQHIEQGTALVEGLISPHELLACLGRDAVAHLLLREIQRVYRGTGAVIHDKHLEIVIRQMLCYVEVIERGDTSFVPGELVNRFAYMRCVAEILAQGGSPGYARPVLLGLTRAVLETSSWLAAASFQETSRVLTHAVIHAQCDEIIGLKEHLIIGQPFTAV